MKEVSGLIWTAQPPAPSPRRRGKANSGKAPASDWAQRTLWKILFVTVVAGRLLFFKVEFHLKFTPE